MQLDASSLADLARGAAFLGSGGGGDPQSARLMGEARFKSDRPVELIAPDTLPDDALIAPCGWIGAPTVSMEKLPNGCEAIIGLRRLEEVLGRTVDALMPIEIGGANGLTPVIAASQLGLPVVDADGMGRAFPESQMVVFNIHGVRACPSVVTDSSGASVVIDAADNCSQERFARAISVAMGGIGHMVEYPLTGRQVKDFAIRGSVSTAIAVGAAIRNARRDGNDPFDALYHALQRAGLYPYARALFDGKIVDIERETRSGFTIGRVLIEAFGGKGRLEVEFQNENLVARRDGKVCASVPDIISIMDRESADTITTERLSFGQRVKIIGVTAPAVLRTRKALAVLGPAAFGMPDEYCPIEILNEWTNT